MTRKEYVVEIPDPHNFGGFMDIEVFETRKAAISFAKETFGADELGKVLLITEKKVKGEEIEDEPKKVEVRY